MKNIFKVIATIFSLLIFFSCEKNVPDYSYNGPVFVAFEEMTLSIKENGSSIKIPVLLTDDRTQEVTVEFELSSSNGAAENIDYKLINPSKTLVFEPGVGTKYIEIEPINDLEFNQNRNIEVKIISNSKNYLIGLPGPDKNNSSCFLTIVEDDCLFIPEEWQGLSIAGTEEATTGRWWLAANSPGKWEFVEESSPNVYLFKVTGFWYAQALSSDWAWYNPDQVEFMPVRVTIDLSDLANPKYSIADDQPYKALYGSDLGVVYLMKKVDSEPLNIDICNRTIKIPYTITGTSWAHNYIFTISWNFPEP